MAVQSQASGDVEKDGMQAQAGGGLDARCPYGTVVESLFLKFLPVGSRRTRASRIGGCGRPDEALSVEAQEDGQGGRWRKWSEVDKRTRANDEGRRS